jgi:polygalacturonase
MQALPIYRLPIHGFSETSVTDINTMMVDNGLRIFTAPPEVADPIGVVAYIK